MIEAKKIQRQLTPELYRSIYNSASVLTDKFGIDAALKALEITARGLTQPTIFSDVRQQAEQSLPNAPRTQQLGDAMVIIFHNHPRYPIALSDSESTRRQKMHIMERIRDFRGMTTEALAESLVEDMATRYVSLESIPYPQAVTVRDFIEDVFTVGKNPDGLGGMAGTVRRLRKAFWQSQEAT